MNDAHVHEMQVQLCKANTRGVTQKSYSEKMFHFVIKWYFQKNIYNNIQFLTQ